MDSGRGRGFMDSGLVLDGFCLFFRGPVDLAVAGAVVIQILASPFMDCGAAFVICFFIIIKLLFFFGKISIHMTGSLPVMGYLSFPGKTKYHIQKRKTNRLYDQLIGGSCDGLSPSREWFVVVPLDNIQIG